MSEKDKAVVAIEQMTGALNRLADGQHAAATAIHRFCDVYLHVNEPDQEQGQDVLDGLPSAPLPDGYRGMR